MQHNTVRQKQRVHHESNDGGEGELIHSAVLGSDGCLCLFRPLGPFVSYIASVRHGINMPLTPARSAAYGAWRDELVLVQKALPDRVPRENYLNVPPIDTAFHERYSSTQSYTIYAHVHGRTFAIYCGDGQQTIKWLALTAARRYGEETPQGRLRRRERFNTDNAPHGTAIASTHEHRQHLRLGGTHRKGQFIPLELQRPSERRPVVLRRGMCRHRLTPCPTWALCGRRRPSHRRRKGTCDGPITTNMRERTEIITAPFVGRRNCWGMCCITEKEERTP